MPNYGYGDALFKDAWAATRSYYAKKVIEDEGQENQNVAFPICIMVPK